MNDSTPTAALAHALATDPARPFLTFYDDASGERIELSYTTFNNWVAKTANLLQDEFATEPGERVTISLPTHWYAAVWMLAAWSAGLVVDLDATPEPEVAVAGPDTIETVQQLRARDTVALALKPLGGPFDEPLPTGVIDYGGEVAGHGDHFVPYVPVDSASPALVTNGQSYDAAGLVAAARDRANELAFGSGDRVLTTALPAAYPGCLDALLAPLVVGASVVLVRNLDEATMETKQASENVTQVLPPAAPAAGGHEHQK